MSRLDELSAELAYEEAKAAYIKAKEKNSKRSGKAHEDYLAAKKAYREAKTAWRLSRGPAGPGDATPDGINVAGGVS